MKKEKYLFYIQYEMKCDTYWSRCLRVCKKREKYITFPFQSNPFSDAISIFVLFYPVHSSIKSYLSTQCKYKVCLYLCMLRERNDPPQQNGHLAHALTSITLVTSLSSCRNLFVFFKEIEIQSSFGESYASIFVMTLSIC